MIRAAPLALALAGVLAATQAFAAKSSESAVAITSQAEFDFGEIWTGQGASFETLSAWLCPPENKESNAIVR